MYGASFPLRNGSSGVVEPQSWSINKAGRQHYKPIQKYLLALSLNLEVIGSGNITDVGKLYNILRSAKLVGGIDVVKMFAGGGKNLMASSHIHYLTVRPRIFILCNQGYWGITDRTQTGAGQLHAEGLGRLPPGNTLGALIRTAEKIDYRLIRCLQRVPIGLFVRKETGKEFGTIEVTRCIHNDQVCKIDTESMLDEPEQYNRK